MAILKSKLSYPHVKTLKYKAGSQSMRHIKFLPFVTVVLLQYVSTRDWNVTAVAS